MPLEVSLATEHADLASLEHTVSGALAEVGRGALGGTNRRGIANYRIVPLASSGPMEKAIDIVVARRFKLRGMSWFPRGVTHLLRLRLLRLNGTWGRYWAARFRVALRPWPAAA